MASKSHSTGAIPKSKPAPVQREINSMDNPTSKYLEALHTEIESNESEQNKLSTEINKIHDVMEQLGKLSEQPEWPDSFIQVNPLAYVPATIIHTGEHYVKLGPEIYTLMSLKETLGLLQRKIDRSQKTLDAFKTQQKQLEERSLFSAEATLEAADTQGMPVEIPSEKGVAHKTAAGFYEVIESYSAEAEEEFYRQRLEHTSRKGKRKMVETSDDYFERLDELQRLEDLKGEFVEEQKAYEIATGDEQNVSERVKTILRKSGVYNYLLEDELVQQHCYEHKTTLEVESDASTATRNESVLNELIVEALINEPVYSINDDISEEFNVQSVFTDDSLKNVSSNDLAALAFLDSIENDIKNWNL